jgi:hypothetical protein
MAGRRLAEGEELGSNILHGAQSTLASSCVRSSWQRRGQAAMDLKRPRPLVGNLHHPFPVKSQWRAAGQPQARSYEKATPIRGPLRQTT